jgi:hypothetical protein
VFKLSNTNVSVANSNEFKFRTTNLQKIDLSVLGTAAVYYSAEVDAQKTGQGSGTLSGDLIIGAIKFIATQIPFTFLGYLKASASLSLNGNLSTFDYTASGAFIFHAALRIEERNPTGSVIRTVALRNCLWNGGSGNDSTGHLRYFNIDTLGCTNFGEKVSFVFFVSDTLGKVDLGNGFSAVVTPKTLESVVIINNWNYADPANSLSLIYGTVSGAIAEAGSVSVSGNILKSGSGSTQVYAAYANVANINGASKSVIVSHAAAANVTAIVEDAGSNTILTAVYKGAGGVQAKITTVTFPAGSNSITYDPTIGSGDYLQDDAKTIIFSVLLLVFVALL